MYKYKKITRRWNSAEPSFGICFFQDLRYFYSFTPAQKFFVFVFLQTYDSC